MPRLARNNRDGWIEARCSSCLLTWNMILMMSFLSSSGMLMMNREPRSSRIGRGIECDAMAEAETVPREFNNYECDLKLA